MTGILLCCAALIAALGALYVVVWHEPWIASRLGAFIRWLRAPADVRNPYTLASDPVDEQFSTAPSEEPFFSAAGVPVVPGDWTAELQAAYAAYRAGLDVFAGARHEPSPEVKQ